MKTNTLAALGLLATFLSAARAQEAKQILAASGVQGGLVVVIGCDTPALLAELRAGDSYLVHGLKVSPKYRTTEPCMANERRASIGRPEPQGSVHFG